MSSYVNYDVVGGNQQMLPTPALYAPEIVYLIFYVLAFLLAVHRFRWAPALFAIVAHAAFQISALSARVYWRGHLLESLDLVRAVQALLAIAFICLLYQLIILKSEHFHVPFIHPSAWLLRRYQIATHSISVLLLAAFVLSIVYASLLGKNASTGNSIGIGGETEGHARALWHAFDIVLFVFWGIFAVFMIFTPFWARASKAATGMFLLLLIFILLIPILYLELRWQRTTDWVANSMTAFHTLWMLPQAVVTVGILMIDISYWYAEDHRTRWIY